LIARGVAARADRFHRRVEPHGELAHHGLLVQQRHAVDRGQRLAGVGRALQQQLAELDDAVRRATTGG
jgi:hypothetical protein